MPLVRLPAAVHLVAGTGNMASSVASFAWTGRFIHPDTFLKRRDLSVDVLGITLGTSMLTIAPNEISMLLPTVVPVVVTSGLCNGITPLAQSEGP